MRARMALVRANVFFACEDINFRDKPKKMLALSPKGTVPVLLLNNGIVIDESLDIIKWALPKEWVTIDQNLIDINDTVFKPLLDQYRYATRHPDNEGTIARDKALDFIETLNAQISLADPLSLTDICIFPFIRQFANVDREWFDDLPYSKVQDWLHKCCDDPLFKTTFDKNFNGLQ
jgi:glutathione S-transferase